MFSLLLILLDVLQQLRPLTMWGSKRGDDGLDCEQRAPVTMSPMYRMQSSTGAWKMLCEPTESWEGAWWVQKLTLAIYSMLPTWGHVITQSCNLRLSLKTTKTATAHFLHISPTSVENLYWGKQIPFKQKMLIQISFFLAAWMARTCFKWWLYPPYFYMLKHLCLLSAFRDLQIFWYWFAYVNGIICTISGLSAEVLLLLLMGMLLLIKK